MASTNYRYDWFQTEATITITIMKKNISPDRCQVKCTDQNVLRLYIDGEDVWSGHLEGLVDFTRTTIKCSPSKIEISLPKSTNGRWSKLLAEENTSKPSSLPKKDWDAIEQQVLREEGDEPVGGEAEVERMFKKIYADANDDVKKAMIKSYSESNGTVLSTNWADISKGKTEVKPPDNVEFKKWDS